jgi:hypothetical protein
VTIAIASSLALAVAAACAWQLAHPSKWGIARAAMAVFALGAYSLWLGAEDPLSTWGFGFYPASFPDYYRGWIQLELATRNASKGTRIAYAGTDLPYYLMGVGLHNDVRYENVNDHPGWLLHHYHRAAVRRGQPNWPTPRPGWDRERPSYEAWLANLRTEQIQLLVVCRANVAEGAHNIADAQGFPIERQWAESHPHDFVPLYGVAEADPEFRIYRLAGDFRKNPKNSTDRTTSPH